MDNEAEPSRTSAKPLGVSGRVKPATCGRVKTGHF